MVSRSAFAKLFGGAMPLLVAAACSGGETGARAGAQPFEPVLPPASITSVFGGQTGSDEASGCTWERQLFAADEQTPLNFTAREAVDAAFGRFEVDSANGTDSVEFVAEIQSVYLEVVDEEVDGGLRCRTYIHIEVEAQTTATKAQANDLEHPGMPILLVASSVDEIVAAGYSRVSENFPALQGLVAEDENLQLFLEVQSGKRRGWVVAVSPDTQTRGIATLKGR